MIDRTTLARILRIDPVDKALWETYALLEKEFRAARKRLDVDYIVSRGDITERFNLGEFTLVKKQVPFVGLKRVLGLNKVCFELKSDNPELIRKIQNLVLSRAAFHSARITGKRSVLFFAPMTTVRGDMLSVSDICRLYNLEKTVVNEALLPFRTAWERYWRRITEIENQDKYRKSTKPPNERFVHNGIACNLKEDLKYLYTTKTESGAADRYMIVSRELIEKLFKRTKSVIDLKLPDSASRPPNFVECKALVYDHFNGVGSSILVDYWLENLRPKIVSRRLNELAKKPNADYVFVLEDVVPARFFLLMNSKRHTQPLLYTDTSAEATAVISRIPCISAKLLASRDNWLKYDECAGHFDAKLAAIDKTRKVGEKRILMVFRDIRLAKQNWVETMESLSDSGHDVQMGCQDRPPLIFRGRIFDEHSIAIVPEKRFLSLQVKNDYVEKLIDPRDIVVNSDRKPQPQQPRNYLDWVEMSNRCVSSIANRYPLTEAEICNRVIDIFLAVAQRSSGEMEDFAKNSRSFGGKLLLHKQTLELFVDRLTFGITPAEETGFPSIPSKSTNTASRA